MKKLIAAALLALAAPVAYAGYLWTGCPCGESTLTGWFLGLFGGG